MESNKNSEGYNDPTASKAIANIERSLMFKRGEIVEIEGTTTNRYGIIIQSFDTYIVYLVLCVNRPENNPYRIEALRDESWVDLGKMNFTFKNKVVNTDVAKMDSNAFEKLIKNIGLALGIINNAVPSPITAPPVEIVQKEIPNNNVDDIIELTKWKTKAEMFEQLYKELLATR